MKVFAIVGAVVLALIVMIVGSAISARNWAVTTEARIEALHQERVSKLANYEIKVVTAAQVPEMYRDDLTKVVRASIEGRYGQDGAKAVFLAISESQINYDATIYKKIQDMIEVGRNDYMQSQTELTDVVAQYKAGLQTFPRVIFVSMMGYPKLNLADYNAVQTDRVEQTFKTGKEEAIKLR